MMTKLAFDFGDGGETMPISNLSTCPPLSPRKGKNKHLELDEITPNWSDKFRDCLLLPVQWERQPRALLFCKAIDSDSTRFITSAEFSAAMTKFEFTKPSKQQLGFDGLITSKQTYSEDFFEDLQMIFGWTWERESQEWRVGR